MTKRISNTPRVCCFRLRSQESIKREPTIAVMQLQFIYKDSAMLESKNRHASRVTLTHSA